MTNIIEIFNDPEKWDKWRTQANVYHLKLEPMGAKRINYTSKWSGSKTTKRYYAYKDALRDLAGLLHIQFEDMEYGCKTMLFVFGMPKDTTKDQRHRTRRRGCLCTKKPDKDNCEKGLLDALFKEDSHFAFTGNTAKLWGWDHEVGIYVETMPELKQYVYAKKENRPRNKSLTDLISLTYTKSE